MINFYAALLGAFIAIGGVRMILDRLPWWIEDFQIRRAIRRGRRM